MAKGEILEEVELGDVCVLNADDPLVMPSYSIRH